MTVKIEIIKDKLLSDNWFTLRNYTYELQKKDGSRIEHKREVYDRGNGATILLYNRKNKPCCWCASSACLFMSMVIHRAC